MSPKCHSPLGFGVGLGLGVGLGGGQASAGRREGMAGMGDGREDASRGLRGGQEVAWEAGELVWEASHGAQIAPR